MKIRGSAASLSAILILFPAVVVFPAAAQPTVPEVSASSSARDEAAKKFLTVMQQFDTLIGAALQTRKTLGDKDVQELLGRVVALNEDNKNAFETLSLIVAKENIDETQAEADALGISVEVYRDSSKTPIWSAFMRKLDEVKSRMGRLSDEQLLAQYLKCEIRLRLQQGRFVADNQFEAEAAFAQFKGEVFDRLGLSNIPR
ncbi:MAG: hypothetical protein WCU88_06815 [Elusimicrobiota bacterium]